MFRNLRRQRFIAGALGPAQMNILERANQLLANGKPAEAAPLFAQLAGATEAGGHPRLAANLHARAAHAYADGGDGSSALVQARSALNLFLEYRMMRRAPVFYANITRKLNDRGMTAAANHLLQEFGSQVSALPANPAAGQPHHGTLPTHCPNCGAPVRGDEVEWVDANTAECDYCGSPIRAEG